MVVRWTRSGMDIATFSVSGVRPISGGGTSDKPGSGPGGCYKGTDILDESYVGVDCINTSTSILFSVAGSWGITTFQLDLMDLQEIQKLKELLENPKCIKVGVNLGKVMALLSSLPYWPHFDSWDSWVDLSEFLWSHSITERRITSLSDIQMLNPQKVTKSSTSKSSRSSSTPPIMSSDVASLCRDVWPFARGLVALNEASRRFDGT